DLGGARRWFHLGPFYFQPAEFAKFAAVIYLADVLSRRRTMIRNFKEGFLPPALLLGTVVLLILMQPDLGTAVLISLMALVLFFAARIPSGWLAGIFLSGIPLLCLLILMEPYRMKRIFAFMNPWADPRGTGFQAIQSLLAFGAGGWTGVGLGKSTQKLFYLPGAHTDFIFSIIGEELGFAGCVGVILLFGALLYFGIKVTLAVRGTFLQLFSLGILSILVLEALINIAVSTAAMPTKGLPLPFISYGGSSLVFHCVGIGLLLNIARQK
ncbi:MAG: cell division protein FtsW, partial [Candidatus Omnitrophica bacterium]|nr:cell division protein FtsW [Candidatus Omnitrophota bacterium]